MYSQTSSRISTSESGFTVFEVMVATVAAMVLLAAFGGFYLQQQRRLQEQHVRLEMAQSVRAALDTMIRELRSAGRNPHAIKGLAGITVAGPSQVQFTLDLNGDGTVSGTDELRGFRTQGNQLQMQTRNTLSGWLPMLAGVKPANGVNDVMFRYYPLGADLSDPAATQLGNNPTADELASIKAIRITLTVQKTFAGRTISQTEVGTADLRNSL